MILHPQCESPNGTALESTWERIVHNYQSHRDRGLSHGDVVNRIFQTHSKDPDFADLVPKLKSLQFQSGVSDCNQSTSQPVNQANQEIDVKYEKEGQRDANRKQSKPETKPTQKKNSQKATIEEDATALLKEHEAMLLNCDEWQTGFMFARIFKNLEPRMKRERRKPTTLRAVFSNACTEYDLDFEAAWYGFLDHWPKIKLPAGQDGFAVAANAAETGEPGVPKELDDYGLEVILTLRFAFHAQRHVGDDPIQLPRKRLAKWLSCSPSTITNIVRVLEAEGWVKCVCQEYSYQDGVAKAYRFIGKCIAGVLLPENGIMGGSEK